MAIFPISFIFERCKLKADPSDENAELFSVHSSQQYSLKVVQIRTKSKNVHNLIKVNEGNGAKFQ